MSRGPVHRSADSVHARNKERPTTYCPETRPADNGVGDCRANRLRGGMAIEAKRPSESLNAFDFAAGQRFAAIRLDQSIVEPLVIPLRVVMSGELPCRLPKRPFPEEDHPIKTLILDRPDEPFGVGVGLGCRMHPMQIVRNDVFG